MIELRMEILQNCLEAQPLTTVMYAVRCNYHVIQDQARLLIKRGLLSEQLNPNPHKWPKALYTITDKGREVLIRTDAIRG